ncbi:MAG TPA: protein phosphatase 2C domain-containing protein [Gemmatimonadales bacterium]|jgi:protein phosphatase
MRITEALTASLAIEPGPKPRDDELDLFGLTHQGLVRSENQDQFLLGTVHQQIYIHGTSLPELERNPLRSERLATIMLVADGVGGGIAGADASQITAARIAHYLTSTMNCYHARGAEKEFLDALQNAAIEAHQAVRAEAAARASAEINPGKKSMASTLTVGLAVWPWLYVLQVGDSRCYRFLDGKLRQVTRDQTLAQDLVDRGALPAETASESPFSNVLASAIGGREAHPVVSRINLHKAGCIVLLCSDGLTKHVNDEEIAEHCATMTSAEQLCQSLLDLVLERGGSDNTTIVVGRARPQ